MRRGRPRPSAERMRVPGASPETCLGTDGTSGEHAVFSPKAQHAPPGRWRMKVPARRLHDPAPGLGAGPRALWIRHGSEFLLQDLLNSKTPSTASGRHSALICGCVVQPDDTAARARSGPHAVQSIAGRLPQRERPSSRHGPGRRSSWPLARTDPVTRHRVALSHAGRLTIPGLRARPNARPLVRTDLDRVRLRIPRAGHSITLHRTTSFTISCCRTRRG